MTGVTKDYISISEFVKKISLSKTTVYRMLKAGKIEGIRIGTKWFIGVVEFERLLNSNKEAKDNE